MAKVGDIIGDKNPMHSQQPLRELPNHPLLEKLQDGDDTKQNRCIVHGMLASGLFSSIFGTLVPGSVYLSQTLKFKSPVYTDEAIVGRVDVLKVKQWKKLGGVIVSCKSQVFRRENSVICISGNADVWLPMGQAHNSPEN